jgi:hypothetical protein
MPDERRRRQVLEAVAAGRLPSHIPRTMWGGLGTGCTCSVCLAPIDSEQVETEIQELGQTYHLHLQCMAAWEALVALGNGQSSDPTLQVVGDGGYSPAGELLPGTGPQ